MKGRDFIVLSDDWHGLPTSTIHLFRRLAKSNRVFWFNLTNRMPQLNLTDARKVVQVLGSSLKGANCSSRTTGVADAARSPMNNPHLVTPFMIPWFKQPVRRLNRSNMLRAYRKMLSRYGITDPVIFAGFPTAGDFVKSVDAPTKVYYCCDEFLDYPGFNPRDWRLMEEELVDAVDGLVVTSRDLERKNRQSLPCQYLPHGVDFEHFEHASHVKTTVPQMEEIPRPIVGFFGLISHWVDLDLIASLSDKYPRVSFVLLGKADVPTTVLRGRENVYLPGNVPYAELPAYARYFDVGLIPFVDSELTRAVNPLKLLEYYALGLPVIATRLPELETASGPIRLASNVGEFSCNLDAVLVADLETTRIDAVETARQNSWDCRANQLKHFLASLSSRQSSDSRNG